MAQNVDMAGIQLTTVGEMSMVFDNVLKKMYFKFKTTHACRLDIKYEINIKKLLSFVWRLTASASEIVYSSALKMLAVLGSLLVLVLLL